MKKSYWNYCPIIAIIFLGFIGGGYLAFGAAYLDTFSFIKDESGRLLITLYGMGMLGATTYCARFWSADIYEVVYEKEKFKPHFFDFVGYITLILGGGITGIILFLIAKTGINISVSSAKDIHLTKAASVLISYVGGLYHFKVQKQLGKVIEKVFQEQNKNKKR